MRSSANGIVEFLQSYPKKRGLAFGTIIVVALLAFELFNYSTTEFALTNLLGDLKFVGVRWGTILALAFCGMDFAGIARLFTPQREPGEAQTDVWYLLGAWFLAATMNAVLTWWGVSLALLSHAGLGNEILSRDELLSGAPIFVAVLVWLIRILLIGTFSMAGDRLFSQDSANPAKFAGRPESRVPAAADPYPARTVGPDPRRPVTPAAKPVAQRPGQSMPRAEPVLPSEARASASVQRGQVRG